MEPTLFFAPLPLQNRFQALLDEIIQQEEREMEQVKKPSSGKKRRENELETPGCGYF